MVSALEVSILLASTMTDTYDVSNTRVSLNDPNLSVNYYFLDYCVQCKTYQTLSDLNDYDNYQSNLCEGERCIEHTSWSPLSPFLLRIRPESPKTATTKVAHTFCRINRAAI